MCKIFYLDVPVKSRDVTEHECHVKPGFFYVDCLILRARSLLVITSPRDGFDGALPEVDFPPASAVCGFLVCATFSALIDSLAGSWSYSENRENRENLIIYNMYSRKWRQSRFANSKKQTVKMVVDRPHALHVLTISGRMCRFLLFSVVFCCVPATMIDNSDELFSLTISPQVLLKKLREKRWFQWEF